MTKYILLIGSILFLSCERSIFVKCPHSYVDVINYSDLSLYVMWTQQMDSSNKASVLGTDPIELGRSTRGHADWYWLPPHKSNGLAISRKSRGCFSSDFVDKNDATKKITVFLFDSSSIYPGKWDYVKQNNICTKTYILNYDSLEQRGWKIVYP